MAKHQEAMRPILTKKLECEHQRVIKQDFNYIFILFNDFLKKQIKQALLSLDKPVAQAQLWV